METQSKREKQLKKYRRKTRTERMRSDQIKPMRFILFVCVCVSASVERVSKVVHLGIKLNAVLSGVWYEKASPARQAKMHTHSTSQISEEKEEEK